MVRLFIGSDGEGELFEVEKELLCRSTYFRKLLQPHRKTTEGNCSICYEALVEDGVKELTYCATSCGNNFHKVCMEEWKRSNPNEVSLKCPMCRQRFEEEGMDSFPTITPIAFHNYLDWLHLSYIPLRPTWKYGNTDTGPDFIALVEAYQLGVFVSDRKFWKATLQNILGECIKSNVYPNDNTVARAYAVTSDSPSLESPLRKLFVEIYMQFSCSDYIQVFREWERFPHEFQSDLTQALMQEHGKQAKVRDWASMLRKLLEDDQDTGSGGEVELPNEDKEATEGFVQNGS